MGGSRGGNKKLPPPVGPLLQTVERLCVDSIDPGCDIAVRLLFNWMCKNEVDDEEF